MNKLNFHPLTWLVIVGIIGIIFFVLIVIVFDSSIGITGGCGDFYGILMDVNHTFYNKAEVLDFFGNSLKKENYPTNLYPWDEKFLDGLTERTRNGSLNEHYLQLESVGGLQKREQCGMNFTDDENFDHDTIYTVYGEKWFISKDGKIIRYYGSGV